MLDIQYIEFSFNFTVKVTLCDNQRILWLFLRVEFYFSPVHNLRMPAFDLKYPNESVECFCKCMNMTSVHSAHNFPQNSQLKLNHMSTARCLLKLTLTALESGLHYAKRSLMSWVIVIPKEGWTCMAAPILLLIWRRLSPTNKK